MLGLRRPSPNSMIAAAILQHPLRKRPTGDTPKTESWQTEAWKHYDLCGELRAGVSWKANSLSRARLYVATASDTDAEPTPIETEDNAVLTPSQHLAIEALAAFGGGPTGQAQILYMVSLQLDVCGDSYIVGWQDSDGGEHWVVRSPREIRRESAGAYSIKWQGQDFTLPSETGVVIRVWREHPNYSWQSDSSVRGVLATLHELEQLTELVEAQVNSRLASAGILFVPNEMDFPPPLPGADGNKPPSVQTLLDIIMQTAERAISDRADPASMVPILISGPGEQIKHVKHVTFWTEVSEKAESLRREAIRRLALGIDVPPEVVLGLAEANHWSSWQISQAAITLHVEPALERICDALTRGFLQPLTGDDDLIIWYDTSELVQHPDRGPASSEVFDRGELSGEALRREHGFSDADAPDDDERRRRVEYKLAEQTVTLPGVAQRVLADIGIEPLGSATVQVSSRRRLDTGAPQLQPAEPAAIEAPPAASDGTQDPDADTAAPFVVAAGVLAAHAFNYVGKKWLKGQPRSVHKLGVPACRLHEQIPVPDEKADFLLAGVWDDFTVDGLPEQLLHSVAAHVRTCLTSGQPHHADHLAAAIYADVQ